MTAAVPDGAQLSEDGQWWWDGLAWQPVPQRGDRQARQGGSSEVTYDELAAVKQQDQIDDRVHPYLAPDYDRFPDDASEAEVQDVLTDEPASGAGGA